MYTVKPINHQFLGEPSSLTETETTQHLYLNTFGLISINNLVKWLGLRKWMSVSFCF